MKTPLVEIKNLKKYFEMKKDFKDKKVQYVKAVDDVTFNINKGETLGLVGESGCGKSTIGRTIMRLYEPTEGKIILNGEDISNLSEKSLKTFRKDMQMIFQDPFASLNPYMTVSDIINEPLEAYNIDESIREDIIYKLLEKVGLGKEDKERYPSEFSGGQLQRIGIARALSVRPKLIVCDEPTSALDVSIQAQIINMLKEIQDDFGISYLFISHNLSVIKHISNRTGIMYLGKIVELGSTELLYNNPLHPYTKALLSAIPIADPIMARTRKKEVLLGNIPSSIDIPKGCRFNTRCKFKMKKCEEIEPIFKEVEDEHMIACHLY